VAVSLNGLYANKQHQSSEGLNDSDQSQQHLKQVKQLTNNNDNNNNNNNNNNNIL